MKASKIFMRFPTPAKKAVFLRRPQRFLAEMSLSAGSTEYVYCTNSGAMATLLKAGSKALLWDSMNTARKRRYTWRAVKHQGLWIGTDTHLSNRIIEEALRQRLIPGLEAYENIQREYRVEAGLRVDFMLSGSRENCFLEIKSSTIVLDGIARYPDSRTVRGQHQLEKLKALAKEGQKIIIIFLVQRGDAVKFILNESVDPAYAKSFKQAIAAGVQVMALKTAVSPAGFSELQTIPFEGKKNDTTTAALGAKRSNGGELYESA